MKKNLLLVLLSAVQISFAQITSKDNTFASNGIHTIASTNNTVAWSRMVQNPDGSIYFTYNRNNSSTGGLEKSFLSKLNVNGTVDHTFGTNGELQLPYFTDDSQVKLQPDGKLVILSSSDSGPMIVRVLPTGQLDSSFGSNGISSAVPALGIDENGGSYGIILQNGKILVHGVDTSSDPVKHRIYRLTAAGAIDTTFGNNGSIFTLGTWSNLTSTFVDNQLNIVCGHANGTLEKFNPDGQPLTGFGNNGMVQTIYNSGGIMDSNNQILLANGVGQISRFKPDGTLDSSFNFNPVVSIPFPIWILSIVEKNDYYYIGGAKEVNNDIRFFISKLNQNGTIDPSFNYYVESNSSLNYLNDMIINQNNIIANGNGYIVKYLVNNPTLSATEILKANTEISFENPVKQHLVYQSKEKVSKIEIYSQDGKLAKTLLGSNTNVSDLLKGVYLAKVTFENKKVVTKKLVIN
ncbi:T9SS type A sorting domain-containing protein [Chryseobacterium kwangjuense]|uniref:Secretion system C-terminal sorting domain-containing protein n=1 Tax=Chryseobacterium kwangjuense TaxID=267125 RepID=A0A135W452_9FLAO|nr:T9SS type A sorting domain-containing protein [Chryseobacterium kwangjuense]KXH79647.1 hypothetical protein AU378_19980 [Chryseobacterium kwangjuense]